MMKVLEIGLSTRNREGHAAVLTLLRHILHALSHPCLKERTGIVSESSKNPLLDWGRSANLEKLNVKW